MTAKTAHKCLVLLELISRSKEPRGVAELAREMGLPKSNAFRLIGTLVETGYVRRRETDSRYELTLKLWEMGMQAFSQDKLVEISRPFLERLAAETEESVHLAIYDEGESVYIDKRDGMHPVHGVTRIGSRAPAYCCATGKATLAYCTEAEVKRVAAGMRSHTGSTIASPDILRQELQAIQRDGYAINRGEWYEDVWGIAAAVRTRTGLAPASIGIWAPRNRVENRIEALGKTVSVIAGELSKALGFSPE